MDDIEEIASKNGTGVTKLRKITGNRRDGMRQSQIINHKRWRKKKR